MPSSRARCGVLAAPGRRHEARAACGEAARREEALRRGRVPSPGRASASAAWRRIRRRSMPARPEMSKARRPSLPRPVSAACSRKMAAGPDQAKASPQPSRAATCATIHQSGRASPAGGRKARWREMTRSLLVTVPSFSAQPTAGRRTCANSAVSVSAMQSDTTRKGARRSASRTDVPSGMDTAGLVAMTQSAPMRPAESARNRSTAFKPGPAAMFGALPVAAHAAPLRPAAPSRDGRRAWWRARPPRARPWRWAGR